VSSQLQLIDLLDDTLRPLPEVISLRELLMGAVVIILLLLLGSIWLQFKTHGLSEVREALSEQQAAIAATNEQLVKQQGAVTKDMLRGQLDVLKRQRDAQSELLLVAGDSPDAARGFSDYMNDLASLHPKGLWLDGIELENLPTVSGAQPAPAGELATLKQRVRIQGKTLDPQLVPEFLEALALNSHFSGTRFDRFELASEKSGPHSFAVFSQAERSTP